METTEHEQWEEPNEQWAPQNTEACWAQAKAGTAYNQEGFKTLEIDKGHTTDDKPQKLNF